MDPRKRFEFLKDNSTPAPREPIEALIKDVERVLEEPCSCEQSLVLQEVIKYLLDFIAYDTPNAPDIDIFDCAVNFAVIEQSGPWYSYDGERIGQGSEKAIQYLKENTDVLKKLAQETRKAIQEQE